MNEWQPIETAPKDGTQVLLCRAFDADHKPIRDGAWGLFVQVAAWWDEEEWIVYCSLPCEPSLHFDPTHWMPLPPPPTGRAEDVTAKRIEWREMPKYG